MSTPTSPTDSIAQPKQASTQPKQVSPLRKLLDYPLSNYYFIVAAGGALVCLGVFMVASAASVHAQAEMGDPYYYGKRQIIFALLGALAAWLISQVSPKGLRILAWPALLLAFGLVGLTYTPLAVEVNGNTNWVRFGPSWTQFQPSEFAKLGLVLWGAWHIDFKRQRLGDLREWLPYVGVSLGLVGMVAVHDLGSAFVMALMLLGILLLAGAPLRLIGAILGAGAALIALLFAVAKNRMDSVALRIQAWLNPNSFPLNENYQPNHGLFALATGGWWGQGPGASKQKWGALKSTGYTDYILAIIGEELGLAGTLTVVGLLFILCFAGIRIVRRLPDTFERLIAAGVTCWFALQALVNIAVVFRCLPVLGVTLPLVSYGGSSLLATLLGLGLLVGCARREPEAAQLLARAPGGPNRIMSVFSWRPA